MLQLVYFDVRNEFRMVKGVQKSIKHAIITFDYVILPASL